MGYTYIDTNTITSDVATLTIDIASGYDEIVFSYKQYRGGDSHGKGFGFQVETGSDTDYDKPMVTQNYGINSAGGGSAYNWQSSEIYDAHTDGDWAAWQHSSVEAFQALSMAGENESGDPVSNMSSSGMLTLYKPKASGTSWKHFIANGNGNYKSGTSYYAYCGTFAGYIKETDALTKIRFKPISGNFDRIIMHQYGLS